ncbi:hypothetical protein D3C72_1370340 [compost metagenome]
MQRLEAGIVAILGNGADDVGYQLLLGQRFGHAHHDGGGVDGVCNQLQVAGQGTGGTGFTYGGLHVGEQHRSVEGKGGHVGIVCGADHANHRGGDGADGASAIVDFDDANAVMVIAGHEVLLVRAHGYRPRQDAEQNREIRAVAGVPGAGTSNRIR